MKSYRIFSKYEHVLVLKRVDRKAELQLKAGEEHVFHSAGEYKMYQKPISAFLASNKLGLEVIEGEVAPKEEVKIDSVEINEEAVAKEVEEAEEAEALAEEEREEVDKAVLLKEKKKEYNKAVRAYKKIPMDEKETKKQAKAKLEEMKKELAELEG